MGVTAEHTERDFQYAGYGAAGEAAGFTTTPQAASRQSVAHLTGKQVAVIALKLVASAAVLAIAVTAVYLLGSWVRYFSSISSADSALWAMQGAQLVCYRIYCVSLGTAFAFANAADIFEAFWPLEDEVIDKMHRATYIAGGIAATAAVATLAGCLCAQNVYDAFHAAEDEQSDYGLLAAITGVLAIGQAVFVLLFVLGSNCARSPFVYVLKAATYPLIAFAVSCVAVVLLVIAFLALLFGLALLLISFFFCSPVYVRVH